MAANVTSIKPGDTNRFAKQNATPRDPARNAGREPGDQSLLSVTSVAADRAALRDILQGSAWQMTAAANCREAVEELRRDHVSVIVCESALDDGTWKDILCHISQSLNPPLLIVTSRLADAYLWSEVLNLGGYDVLATPFRPQEVRYVLTTASLHLAHTAPGTRLATAFING